MEPLRAPPRLELVFRPNSVLVTCARHLVSAFCEETLGDLDVASRVAVAAHELLENVVKYATDGLTRLRVEVERDAQTLTLSVRNRTDAQNVEVLRREVEEIQRAGDPSMLYQRLLRRSLVLGSAARLGLGRIHSESGMTLRLEVEADAVEIVARTHFGAPA